MQGTQGARSIGSYRTMRGMYRPCNRPSNPPNLFRGARAVVRAYYFYFGKSCNIFVR